MNSNNVDIGSEAPKTRKRSERTANRKAQSVGEGGKTKKKKDVAHKTVQGKTLIIEPKKSSKAKISDSNCKKSVVEPLKEKIDRPSERAKKVSATLVQSTSRESVLETSGKQQMTKHSEEAPKKTSVEKSTQSLSRKSFVEPPKEQIEQPVQVNQRRKRKSIQYEIDCSGISMDTTKFRKDLWNRVKSGKLNSVKNVKIKQTGNIIHLTSRCYLPKKCVRSNVHFLTTTYFRQKIIDRAVHIVGKENSYKLIHK